MENYGAISALIKYRAKLLIRRFVGDTRYVKRDLPIQEIVFLYQFSRASLNRNFLIDKKTVALLSLFFIERENNEILRKIGARDLHSTTRQHCATFLNNIKHRGGSETNTCARARKLLWEFPVSLNVPSRYFFFFSFRMAATAIKTFLLQSITTGTT